MKKFIVLSYILWVIVACSNNKSDVNSRLEVLNNIINSEIFIRDHLGKTDSIYLIRYSKNNLIKLYSNVFKIGYLQSNRDSTIIDFSTTSFNDNRTRLSFPRIEIKENKADVILIVYKGKIHYEYNFIMVFSDNKWKFVTQSRKIFD